jgi:uncharacterized membrane protein
MADQLPPQQAYTPPYTDTPYTDIPNAGSASYPPPAGYPPQQGYPPPAGYPPVAGSSAGGLSTNSAAALAYVTIIPAIVFLVLEPYNKIPLVRFHSIQCLALAVVWFALQVALTILAIILHVIPLIGILFTLLHLAVGLGMFIAWLMCIIKASKGEWFKLPVIGDFALKQARS